MFIKATLVWVTIALAETLNGICRVRFLNRRLGDHRSRKVGVLTGSLMILFLGWWLVPWIGPRSPGQALAVGALWVALMLAFDLGLGRWYFRAPWKRLAADFDVRRGGWLGLGMLVLLATPPLMAWIHGLITEG